MTTTDQTMTLILVVAYIVCISAVVWAIYHYIPKAFAAIVGAH